MKRIFGFGKKHNGHNEAANDAPGSSKKVEVSTARVVQPQTPVYLQQHQPNKRPAPVVSEEDEFAEFDAMMAEVKQSNVKIQQVRAEKEQAERRIQQTDREIKALDRQALEINERKYEILNQMGNDASQHGQKVNALVRERQQNSGRAGVVY